MRVNAKFGSDAAAIAAEASAAPVCPRDETGGAPPARHENDHPTPDFSPARRVGCALGSPTRQLPLAIPRGSGSGFTRDRGLPFACWREPSGLACGLGVIPYRAIGPGSPALSRSRRSSMQPIPSTKKPRTRRGQVREPRSGGNGAVHQKEMHPGGRIACAGLALVGAAFDFDFRMGASENKKARPERVYGPEGVPSLVDPELSQFSSAAATAPSGPFRRRRLRVDGQHCSGARRQHEAESDEHYDFAHVPVSYRG